MIYATSGSLWGHFGITLRLLWDHFAHFGITLGALGIYERYFGITLVRFPETLIFPHDFDDFVYLWGDLGATLGSLWITWRYFVESFWNHFGILFWIILGSLCALWDQFGVTLNR